jgi:signal transduction histidine kinase
VSDVFELPRDATLQERSLMRRLADPSSYLATAAAIESDPECATNDVLELADARRTFQRHTGPVRDAKGALIGRIIVLREITKEREVARLKSELVATVSHELRTPLASVLGFAELLRYTKVDHETSQRYLGIIDNEAKRLTALVDDFLDLEKIEAGRFELALESFDLGLLLQRQVEFFGLQSAAHRLAFDRPDEPLALLADRNRIGQVIANLISNAIKYSPRGGVVTVAAVARDDTIAVSVTDSGIGIPPSQQANLFTRFFRVDSSDTRAIGGTGLGLALCKEIVVAHGGTMGLESSEGTGSTFWFELPIVSAGRHEPVPPGERARAAG